MKSLLVSLLMIFSSQSIANSNPCVEQTDEMGQKWAAKEGRSQAGGWIFFTGRGYGESREESYFLSEGQALKRLIQECRFVHKFAKFNERCDEELSGKVSSFVRVSVRDDNCKETSGSDEKKYQNPELNIQFVNYKKKIAAKLSSKYSSTKEKEIDSKIQKINNQLNQLVMQKRQGNINQTIKQKNQEIIDLKRQLFQSAKSCKSKTTCYDLAEKKISQGEYYPAAVYALDACERYGSGKACNLYGVIYRDNFHKVLKSKDGFKKGCNLKYAESCYNLGLLFFPGKTKEQGLNYLKLGCDLGYGLSCTKYVSRRYRDGKQIWKNKKIVKSLYSLMDKACLNHKDPKVCISASEKASNLVSMKNENKALEYAKYACLNLKSLAGCNRLSKVYYWPKFKNLKLMEKYGLMSCSPEYLEGCYDLASFYEYTLKDKIKQIKYLQMACDQNYGRACAGVGLFYDRKLDINNARIYYHKACIMKESRGCGFLAHLEKYHFKNLVASRNAYQMGCDLGGHQALENCAGIAMLNIEKHGFNNRDWNLIDQACHRDKRGMSRTVSGCFNRAIIEEKYKKNKKAAKIFYKDACELKWARVINEIACKKM
ncbi:MAG: sel1 repeat family protein [Bacteriovoracaceae bacterium]|nr:sel1 repeat family protein [Bacteriovoracaceae bacterium]